jgi:hypothetical protein
MHKPFRPLVAMVIAATGLALVVSPVGTYAATAIEYGLIV